MSEEVNMSKAIDEIKNANEAELRKFIEQWYERTRTDGLRIGAKMICAAVFGAIQKHLKKDSKVSLRDYERCIKNIKEIISVPLTKQNDLENNETTEEIVNDGTAE